MHKRRTKRVATPFAGSGMIPSELQQKVLDHINNHVSTNINVANPVQGKQFLTKPVIDHFIGLGYARGTISSALNWLRKKGWLMNLNVQGYRSKIWYC